MSALGGDMLSCYVVIDVVSRVREGFHQHYNHEIKKEKLQQINLAFFTKKLITVIEGSTNI